MQSIQVSRQNIIDQIAALLYAVKKVPDDQQITDILFGNLDEVEDGIVRLIVVTKGGVN